MEINSTKSTVSSVNFNFASHFITLELSIDNYLLYNAQILPFLKGQQLYGYIDGSIPKPSPTVNGISNPAYSN